MKEYGYEIEKNYKQFVFVLVTALMSMFIVLPISSMVPEGNLSENVETKIYSNATLDDDFADNIVMVVMNHNVSMELTE